MVRVEAREVINIQIVLKEPLEISLSESVDRREVVHRLKPQKKLSFLQR